MVLLAICDHRYKFLWLDFGAAGRKGDAGIFSSTTFMQLLENEEKGLIPCLGLPRPMAMPFSDKVLPFVFVGDEAFPMKYNLMRPYPGRVVGTLSTDQQIFNLRLINKKFVLIQMTIIYGYCRLS